MASGGIRRACGYRSAEALGDLGAVVAAQVAQCVVLGLLAAADGERLVDGGRIADRDHRDARAGAAMGWMIWPVAGLASLPQGAGGPPARLSVYPERMVVLVPVRLRLGALG